MAIRYTCRHCDTEIGSLPFESAKELIVEIQQLDEGKGERFLTFENDGEVTVRCICEQCEQSLRTFPDYYTLAKWLQ
ncbi:anti-sigma-F factor Fin [Sporosarcina sp. HYO08]|uniref:anti-sigma-F factor Fin n=1 Tax=Sporosarcina sp. HYO08 TaxID=1759557 RepID=UPI000793C446|nr:anti-sigma-F factor Fin [Sporosarcina sp. HYO08]KXH86823.1 hypothetical protein AU377_13990 [Sporosarcina sp. HYO08]